MMAPACCYERGVSSDYRTAPQMLRWGDAGASQAVHGPGGCDVIMFAYLNLTPPGSLTTALPLCTLTHTSVRAQGCACAVRPAA